MPDGYSRDADRLGDDDPADDAERLGDDDPADDADVEHPATADREFDYRGWTLVAVLAVSLFGIPAVIYLYPYVGTMFGLTFYDTYLALPMVPAVVLGILAVWATTRP